MSTENLGWLFYKKYYSETNFTEGSSDNEKKEIEKENKEKFTQLNTNILNRKYADQKSNFHLFHSPTVQPFEKLKIMYPGLLTGSGYTHETGLLGEFKMGFYFDHVTGLPVLPGHSVKGALRASFPQYHKGSIKHQEEKTNHLINIIEGKNFGGNIEAKELLTNYLKSINITKELPAYSQKLFITILENNIFSGNVPDVENGVWKKDGKGYLQFKPLGIYERDIFMEAYPISGDSKGFILATDSITPHPEPLQNPNPILFLKIRSGVHLQFQFNCKDGIISKEHKIQLFRHLLINTGVGAKTNVGYGQFEP